MSALERVQFLSEREWDVFRLLSLGSSNRDVSRALYITERTVKAHIASIVAKLAVDGRFQAALVSYVYHVQNCPKGQ
jgi:DNA-binding NarL/FixJ family response regulator